VGDDGQAPRQEPSDAGPDADHDHAWRRVSAETEYAAAFEYRCDICGLTWSM
jgi:hypothetical protein